MIAQTFQRKAFAISLALVTSFALTSCIKSNVEMKIKPNDKLDGTIIVAITDQFLTVSGKSRDVALKELKAEMAKSSTSLPKGVKTSFYDKGSFVGQQVEFKDLPASEFNKVSGDAASTATAALGLTGASVALVKKNNTWEFSGTLDLSSTEGLDQASLGSAAKLKPDVKVKITFPGKIISKDKWAKVSGNTVSWSPKPGEKVVMKVVAKTS